MSYVTKIDTLGVTGQRPKSLGLGAFDPKHPVWLDAYSFVQLSLNRIRPSRLVSGGALGFDMIAGKAAIDADVPLVLALPFEGYDSWGAKDKRRLSWLRERACEEFFVCDPGYAPWKYQRRNEAIVERSDYMLAFWNGGRGGTANCLEAAKSAGVGYHAYTPRLDLLDMVPA